MPEPANLPDRWDPAAPRLQPPRHLPAPQSTGPWPHQQPQAAWPAQQPGWGNGTFPTNKIATDQHVSAPAVVIAWCVTVVTLGYMLPWAVAATRGKSNATAIGLVKTSCSGGPSSVGSLP